MTVRTMLAYEAKTQQGKPTFKLMPLTNECLFVEAMYDPESKVMVVLNKAITPRYFDKPRYDAKGKVTGISKEIHPTFFEHEISEKDDILAFIKHHVSNDKHEALKILEI